uniref:Uncharacterized protein n=1 Tax=Anguilla anguilla TaxID=7936 RepID=A0A0E9XDD8_ANGAN
MCLCSLLFHPHSLCRRWHSSLRNCYSLCSYRHNFFPS